jgi:uncharacterized damage-inducible protein DinB
MDIKTTRMLARYNAWANKTLFDAVAALPAGEATRERASLFPTMVHSLNHLYVVDLIWQAHLQGREHGIPALNTVLHDDLAELWEVQQDIDDWYIGWADELTAAQADETVRFKLVSGNRGEMKRADVMLHVVNHTSYHRGFVADMFYQVPARPPLTDLPVYLRESAQDKASK